MKLSSATIQERIGNKSEPRTPGEIVKAIVHRGQSLIADWGDRERTKREAYFLHYNTIQIMKREGWLYNIEHNAALDGVICHRLTTREELLRSLPEGTDSVRIMFHTAYCLSVIPAEITLDLTMATEYAESSCVGLEALKVIKGAGIRVIDPVHILRLSKQLKGQLAPNT